MKKIDLLLDLLSCWLTCTLFLQTNVATAQQPSITRIVKLTNMLYSPRQKYPRNINKPSMHLQSQSHNSKSSSFPHPRQSFSLLLSKNTPLKFSGESRLRGKPNSRKTSQIIQAYGGHEYEQVPEDFAPVDIPNKERFDSQTYVPNHRYHKLNVPRFEVLTYNSKDTLQYGNGGYFYALDARKPIMEEHWPNELPVKDIGLPGSLKYGNSNHTNEEDIKVKQMYVYYGKDNDLACKYLKELIQIDGARFVKNIPDHELTRPEHHYFAAYIRDRSQDGPDRERDEDGEEILMKKDVQRVLFLRLNQGGIWSTKIVVTHAIKFPVFYPKNGEKTKMQHLREDAMKPVTAEQFKACGFFRVTQKMKKLLMKEGMPK